MNFSFFIRKLAVAFYMINEIQPKIKFQNIVQCPFKATNFASILILLISVSLGLLICQIKMPPISIVCIIYNNKMSHISEIKMPQKGEVLQICKIFME